MNSVSRRQARQRLKAAHYFGRKEFQGFGRHKVGEDDEEVADAVVRILRNSLGYLLRGAGEGVAELVVLVFRNGDAGLFGEAGYQAVVFPLGWGDYAAGVVGQLDVVGVAAGGDGGLADDVLAAAVFGYGVVGADVAEVGDAAHGGQHIAFAVSAHQDGGCRALDGFGLDGGAGHLVMLPMVVNGGFRPELADEVDGLLQHRAAGAGVGERDAAGLGVTAAAAGADAEGDAPAADDIQGGGHFRRQRGMAVGAGEHHRHGADAFRLG